MGILRKLFGTKSQADERLEKLFQFSLGKVQEWENKLGKNTVEQIQRGILQKTEVSLTEFYTREQLQSCSESQLENLKQIVKDYVEFKMMLSSIGMTLKLSPEGLAEVSNYLAKAIPGLENKLKGYIGFLVQEMATLIRKKYGI